METELLTARIADTADICERNNKPKFMGFLSPEQSVLAEKQLSKRRVKYSLFGGYAEADRVLLGCFPEWCEDFIFPIASITFSYRKSDKLSHRDFLGSLMALGIKRESVGDILVEDGRAIVFVAEEIADYVLNEIKKIGRVGVSTEIGFREPLPKSGELKEFSETVASLRLDCIVSAIADISRNAAVEKIADGFVAVNSVITEKTTRQITDGDIITVRGSGKFIIVSATDRSKKDRVILKYKKYV